MNYYFLTSIIYLTAGVLIFILGLVIFRENPKQRINQVTGLMMLFAALGPIMGAFGLIIASTPQETAVDQSFFRRFFLFWEFFFPLLLLFACYYPNENPVIKRHPKFAYWIFIPHIFHFIIVLCFRTPDEIQNLISFESLNESLGILFQPISILLNFLLQLVGLFYEFHVNFFALINLLYVISAILMMYAGYKKVSNPHLRKQVGLVLWGIRGSVGLYAIAFLLPKISPLDVADSVGHGITVIALLLGACSIAWAIIKYQFLDIRLFLRRGIVFSLASGLVVGFYLLLYGQTKKIATAVFGFNLPIIEVMFLILAVFFFQPILSWIERTIERAFSPHRTDISAVLQSLSHDIMTTLDMDELKNKIVTTLKENLAIEFIHLIIQDAQGKFITQSPESSTSTTVEFSNDSEVIDLMRSMGKPTTFQQMQMRLTDKNEVEKLASLRPYFFVPLMYRTNLIGILSISSREMRVSYSTEEAMLLEVLSGQIAIALENSKLYEEALAKRRMEEEITLAREIQRLLLPLETPYSDFIELAALNIPCKQVGGDYYDFVEIGGGCYGIAIGDISGKGIPASLLMSNLQAAFRASSIHLQSPNQVMSHVNRHIARTTSVEKYATFIYGIYDSQSHVFSYANAGHNYPIWMQSTGECKMLHQGDLIIGLDESFPYQDYNVILEHGDVLVFYTDGITEALNMDYEEYGEKRLIDAVTGYHNSSAEGLRNHIYETVSEFTKGVEQYDDITLVVLKVK
jgi:sigma-B regulation protein RsbU (phosphoserine phosphatase)